MAGPTGGVAVALGGEERVLRYTTGAIIHLESKTGLTFGEHAERISRVSIGSVVALLWAGLLHADPGLKLDDVAEWLELADLAAVTGPLTRALDLAMTGGAGADEGNG